MIRFLPLFGRESTPCLEYYTIIYMLLIDAQMMLDAAVFQTVINVPEDSTEDINMYQCVILPIHCLQATLQFFAGFDLYKAVVRMSYRRARNWQWIYFCLLAIEIAVFIAYMALAPILTVFTYVTGFAVVFKIYLIWPLRIFLEECRESVPLAQAASPMYYRDYANRAAQPGPSGACFPIISR